MRNYKTTQVLLSLHLVNIILVHATKTFKLLMYISQLPCIKQMTKLLTGKNLAAVVTQLEPPSRTVESRATNVGQATVRNSL